MNEIIPAVMYIEMAKDMLKRRDLDILVDEAKEFNCLGPTRMSEIRDSVGFAAGSGDFGMVAGYLLGLETARALLETNVRAVQAEVMI